ncbi:serine hydrolase [Nocardioides dongxiaopingii]|uniref:serine hydrolase n=1 Tax=Nocardioides dongxiaopingii TaxID=2576036 RepID=UPI0010C76316|nr:serine hydrolase [Nocardioides dongxiaopingii]
MTWSVLVVDADTDEVLAAETPDAVLRTASVAKVLLLSALAEALEAGTVTASEVLDRSVTPRVADSGLWHRLDVAALPVGDVATLVGTVSDNWATNVLVERLGLDVVQAVGPREGLGATQLWDVVRDDRGPADPPTLSTGTASEWVSVLTRLHRGTWVSPAVSARVLGWLAGGADHSMVAGALGLDPLVVPDGPVRVVSKTGTDDGVRCDVGLVTGPGRTAAYAVLANDGDVTATLARMRGLGDRVRAWVS